MAGGATRPRYGGTLRIQAFDIPSPEASPLVAETLCRIDDHGDLRPGLALSWQHDAAFRRWRFTLRSRVLFHDGTPLTAALAAPVLSAALGLNVTAAGQQLVIQSAEGEPNLAYRLSRANTAIARRGGDGVIATGPFRVVKAEPGRRLVLSAFEDHWAGRPFVDGVEFAIASPRADVTQVAVTVSRRAMPERATQWLSPARDLLAIQMINVHLQLREALALALDREPIGNVIAQRRGEPARSLLPEWLSGYAFLFGGVERDVLKAKQLAQGQRTGPLTIAVPPNDSFARAIADRIALNARDAGIVLSVSGPGSQPNLRLLRLRLASNNAADCLTEFARELNPGDKRLDKTPAPTAPQALYEMERALLADGAILPIVHVPEVYVVAPRVHAWDAAHIENVWVEP